MPRFSRSTCLPTLLLTLLVVAVLLACRTTELLTESSNEKSVASNARELTTEAPTRPRPRPSLTPALVQQQQVQTAPNEPAALPPALPTDAPAPTDPPPEQQPQAQPQEPTSIIPTPRPQPTPTDSGPTATPGPTRCPQTYCVVFRGCQPDAGNTVIEGFVYNNGVPENGVAVRVAKEEGAYPLVDDFISGNSTVNPGKPDPNTPGYYFLQIVAGAPREGNWWVFVIDVPNGTKVISESKLIHTNDDPNNPGNCQHAFVDFVR